MALAFAMWGHRKIAWLCRHDGVEVSDATCLRVLRDSGLVLPADYVRERRDLAKARREAFVTIPTRRNRVWQTTSSNWRPRAAGPGAPKTSSTTPPSSSPPARSHHSISDAFGTRRTFLVFALTLVLIAVVGLSQRTSMLAPIGVAALLALPGGLVKGPTEADARVIHEAQTEYQYARVLQDASSSTRARRCIRFAGR